MIARIKKLLKAWRDDRQQLRELTIKLEGLGNSGLIHQHELDHFEMPMYNAIYKKDR